MLPQQYCLRWRYHHSNLQTMFSQLLEREAFCDVTLACEGRTIKAHKIVLSACSTYFETILSQYEEKDPILIMKDVKYVDIKCLVEFMYRGEINVDHCHLATLLKTAEELKIKGLAEVSWRDEDQNSSHGDHDNGGGNDNGVGGSGGSSTSNGLQQSALPQVSTVMDTPKVEAPLSNKRKRGRPPIDDYEQAFTAPKIMTVTGNADEGYSNDAMSTSDHDLSIWEEEPSANEGGDNTEPDEPPLRVKRESTLMEDNDDLLVEDSRYSPTDSRHENSSFRTPNNGKGGGGNVTTSGSQSFLTPALEKEWTDVIKMNDYLSTGRRQQFWEEPFTKRVMDAIKTKNLEMKVAAELLGVSYGTLYGRYRDSYGCLKHPYRVRDFWTEQGPTDVLLKLKKKEITLYRAAEQLNVTPQTLSNYLISMSQIDEPNSSGLGSHHSHMDLYDDGDSDDANSILPDMHHQQQQQQHHHNSSNSSLFKHLLNSSSTASNSSAVAASNSVLANCPDITIIKKEKHDGKVNNNSDHSDSNSDLTK